MFEIQLRRNKMSKGKNIALENRGLFFEGQTYKERWNPLSNLNREIGNNISACDMQFVVPAFSRMAVYT